MKKIWTIPILFLTAGPVLGAVPKMTSDHFAISSSEFSAMGKYKSSASFDTWDTLGQPTAIGAWLEEGNNSGAGWIYTISLPVLWDKDRDNDGMPLAFEEQFALWTDTEFNVHTLWDYNAADAPMDFDGDGFTNIQEYLARTDPTDPTSFFQFTDIRLVTLAANQGRPLITWISKTTKLDGFESEFPDYRRSLGFDILYADWVAASQGEGSFPGEDWFNLTGTWKLLETGTDLKRDTEFNTFTETFAGGAMNTGDIRFYRMAIAGTWDQGTPEVTWGYYSTTGDMLICSTLAQEVLMVQKHIIPSGSSGKMFGMAGNTTGSEGKLDFALGKDLFLAGGYPADATNLNLWVAQTASMTEDYLQDNGEGGGLGWYEYGQGPSTRRITAEDGFSLIWYDDYEPSGAITFYVAAQLKLDPYQHVIHQREWNGQSTPPDNPSWGAYTTTQVTLFAYNFPVEARFTQDFNPPFPKLAGATSPSSSIFAFFENDWVMFYDRNIGAGQETVVVYNDHADATWKYYIPFRKFRQAVGDELKVSPGSPGVIIQFCDPTGWTEHTIADTVPYQDSGNNKIKSYLKTLTQ